MENYLKKIQVQLLIRLIEDELDKEKVKQFHTIYNELIAKTDVETQRLLLKAREEKENIIISKRLKLLEPYKGYRKKLNHYEAPDQILHHFLAYMIDTKIDEEKCEQAFAIFKEVITKTIDEERYFVVTNPNTDSDYDCKSTCDKPADIWDCIMISILCSFFFFIVSLVIKGIIHLLF